MSEVTGRGLRHVDGATSIVLSRSPACVTSGSRSNEGSRRAAFVTPAVRRAATSLDGHRII